MNKIKYNQGLSTIAGIIIVIIAIAAGILIGTTVKKAPGQIDEKYQASTQAWQTYTNQQYGFEFQHPNGWTVQQPVSFGKDGFGLRDPNTPNLAAISIFPNGEFDHGFESPCTDSIIQLGGLNATRKDCVDYVEIKITDSKPNWSPTYNRIEFSPQYPDQQLIEDILDTFIFF